MTLDQFSLKTGLARNTIARIERDEVRHIEPRIFGRILPHLADLFKVTFSGSDPYDFLIPPKTFGGWLRNQRLRRGMAQKHLAKSLGVHVFTVIRYETDRTKPDASVRERIKNLLDSDFERFM